VVVDQHHVRVVDQVLGDARPFAAVLFEVEHLVLGAPLAGGYVAAVADEAGIGSAGGGAAVAVLVGAVGLEDEPRVNGGGEAVAGGGPGEEPSAGEALIALGILYRRGG